MRAGRSLLLGKYETQKLGCGAMLKILLVTVFILSVLYPAVLPNSGFQRSVISTSSSCSEKQETTELLKPIENQLPTGIDVPIPPHNEEKIEKTDRRPLKRILEKQEAKKPNNPEKKEQHTGSDTQAQYFKEKQTQEMSPSVSFNVLQKTEESNAMIEFDEKQGSSSKEKKQESNTNMTISEVVVKIFKLMYNSTNPRYNICSIEGDIRVVPNASTIFFISPTPLNTSISTWKIKPYPRKWELYTMDAVTEMTIQQLADPNQARRCDVTHDFPAVVFSTAKVLGNLFHDYTDMLYPLFLATHRFNGKVKLVVEDYMPKSMEKYQPYLTRLSHYPIINLDNEKRVHCFSSVQVGLENPGPLGYIFQNPQNDRAMKEFRQFIRESLFLKKSEIERRKKPQLLMLLRKHTRSIINEDEVINLAKDVGFEVVTADVEATQDFPRIAHIVNSCDVLMGIHGAGLANMLYLPTNGIVLQIIPFGNLLWVGRYDYGDPPRGFGLNYVEYEITLDESTLLEKYPREHPVLTDPLSIHKKGWQEVYNIYLYDQNVKLDVNKFRRALEEAFQLYK